MLLGVLLALAAGTIVIYVVSQATGVGAHTVTVVIASQDLTPGKLLSATTSDSSHVLISSAFTTKQVNADFVPTGYYTYTDLNHLNIALNDKVVVGQFYQGDILRTTDPRLVDQGQSALGSLTLKNPAALPKGSVLYPLKLESANGLVMGDHVDILVTYCVANGSAGGAQGCNTASDETQTTLQNVYVYDVSASSVLVVLTHEDALTLKLMVDNGGNITLVLRSPGDSDPAGTFPSTGSYIYSHFHFTQP
jgi:Flp pilus assembly protein CpaB